MKRSLQLLKKNKFNILIIGGGIYGATIALAAAKAGLKTALIEKDDFGNATSANSLKILHGGLRYLQHLNFKRMRESIVSRREFMRFAPHLVKPLACAIPLYGYGLKSKEIMRAGLIINDLIGWDRNKGIDPPNCLPDGEILSPIKCMEVIPGLPRKGLRGAALWYDALAIDTERLVTAYISEAHKYGACVANYVEAKELIAEKKHVKGVNAIDAITESPITIQADLVINVSGPWFEKFLSPLKLRQEKQNWAKAVNIIVNKELFKDVAVGLESTESYVDKDAVLNKGKRLYFFVPWQGYTMVGTAYELSTMHPDDVCVTPGDLEKFVDDINAIYPPAQLSYEDVSHYHCGLLPASELSDSVNLGVQLEKNSRLIDHELTDDIGGIISVKSIKYTTAPENAKVLIDYILTKKDMKVDRSAKLKPANDDINDAYQHSINGIDQNMMIHLKSSYGNYYKKLLQYLFENAQGLDWITKTPRLTVGEIIYFVREEMALKLSDIVFRRTGLGTAGCPKLSVLRYIADVAGRELGWDEQRKAEEINTVVAYYQPLRKKAD